MGLRDTQILEAAFRVFSKYGVSKTTMNDIASEAGVARQTVYNAFPGKPELLRACVRAGVADAQANVQAGWQTAETLSAKIDVFFAEGPIKWFEMVQSSPEVAELVDGMSTHAAEELATAAKSWRAMFVEMLAADGVAASDPAISRADLAEFLYSTAINAKYNAESIEVLHDRLRVIKAALLQLVA